MSSLSELHHLNILSWQTEHFLDGTFRSTKTLKMEFKELPPWFTMEHVDKENKVEPTKQILDYIEFDKVSTIKNELIAITFAEKSKYKEIMAMMDIAKVCCSDCGEDCCDCEQSDDDGDEEEEEEEENLIFIK